MSVIGWRTRKKGSLNQVGQHFPVIEKGSKRDLPKGPMKVYITRDSELSRKKIKKLKNLRDILKRNCLKQE